MVSGEVLEAIETARRLRDAVLSDLHSNPQGRTSTWTLWRPFPAQTESPASSACASIRSSFFFP